MSSDSNYMRRQTGLTEAEIAAGYSTSTSTPGISEDRLAEIEALANAATEGPWTWWDGPEGERRALNALVPDVVVLEPFSEGDEPVGEVVLSNTDASFIAASRSAVPEMLDEVRRLRQQVERVTQENAAMRDAMRSVMNRMPCGCRTITTPPDASCLYHRLAAALLSVEEGTGHEE